MVSEAMKQTPEVLHHHPPQEDLPQREVRFRSLVNEDTDVVHGHYIQMKHSVMLSSWIPEYLDCNPTFELAPCSHKQPKQQRES